MFLDDVAWIKELQDMPRGKVLVDHLAALNSIALSHERALVESSAEQCSTWLRVFCHAYAHKDTPFDMVSSLGGGLLPKSVAICNLSGRYGFFYSEKYSLAKVLCLVAQRKSTRLVKGVMQVISKAEETGGSVLVCFCLPFQAGIERVHWTVRTIRKTASGAVKDGELCFSPFDDQPREVPCTASVEHWSSETLTEVGRTLANKASPVCLDRAEECAGVKTSLKTMSPEQMSSMIELLTTDRRKVLDLHKAEKAEAEIRHNKQLEELQQKLRDAEQTANMRVSKVIHCRKLAEETTANNIKKLKEDNEVLQQQLAAEHTVCKERVALLNGQKLEHEQELKQYILKQKALETHVNTLNASHSKQIVEHAKQRREYLAKTGQLQSQLAALRSERTGLERKLSAASSSVTIIEASGKECRTQLTECKRQLSEAHEHAQRARVVSRILRGCLALAGVRVRKANLLSDANSNHIICEVAQKEVCLRSVRDTDERLEQTEAALEAAKSELHEARAQIRQHKHLVVETQKRASALEKRLSETTSDSQLTRAGSNQPPPNMRAHSSTQRTVPTAHVLPPAHYTMDPALENAISQLHSSLNCITALARSSTASTRQVEVLQAKLDAIYCFPSSCGYYDPYGHSCLPAYRG